MEVKIKRIDQTLPLPQYHTPGAVAFDFYSRTQIILESKKIDYAPTNFVIQTPPGYMLLMAARSSLHKRNLMLPNSIGVIDQDYCGDEDEIKIALYNFGDETVTIEKGERLAQGIFIPIEKANWIEVEKMENNNRGGYGSTGK